MPEPGKICKLLVIKKKKYRMTNGHPEVPAYGTTPSQYWDDQGTRPAPAMGSKSEVEGLTLAATFAFSAAVQIESLHG
jgi:hypothetical protein